MFLFFYFEPPKDIPRKRRLSLQLFQGKMARGKSEGDG